MPLNASASWKYGLELRQHRRDLLQQRARIQRVHAQRVAVVAVHQALQRAVLADALEERPGGVEDGLLVDGCHEPRVVERLADVEGDLELREEAPREREAGGLDERVVEPSLGHLLEQFHGGCGRRQALERRRGDLRMLRQQVFADGFLDHAHGLAGDVFEGFRARLPRAPRRPGAAS
jgi:hypothetical protein